MTWFNILPEALNMKEKMRPFFKKQLPIAPTEYDTLSQVSGMKLLRFKTTTTSTAPAQQLQTPLFIIPSMINRYYVLDLLPGKSFIEFLQNQGVPIYLLDWGVPYDEDNWLTLDQLLTQRLDYFMDLIATDSKSEKVNLFGHCLGGTLTTMYTLRFPERVNTLLLLTAPIDFDHGGKLGLWVRQNQFHPETITKAYGHMPWWVLQSSFQMLKPMLPMHKLEKFFKELNNPEFMKNFWALEIWSQDNVSFPGRCFITLIDELYRKNSLIKGELCIAGQTLSLDHLNCPTLNIAASDDHIVLHDSTMHAHHLNSNITFETIISQGGHIGSILGSKAQKTVWPEVLRWLSRWDMGKH
ncbi:MAG: alpha/beta fold hydrolase [Bdellovibrionaceae bacterium]|nr:alpha/beta fold hydrolase [Pseudobdellovibrionaceae bacterium]